MSNKMCIYYKYTIFSLHLKTRREKNNKQQIANGNKKQPVQE